MSSYPIFSRTLIVAIPTCAAVPLFGVLAGALVGILAFLLVARGLLQ